MQPPDAPRHHLHRPSIDSFVFEGENTPLLLRRGVVLGIVGGFVALVATYIVIAELAGIPYDIDAEPFRDWVEAKGAWGPIVFILVMALSVLFAPIPNVPIFIAAGLAWGSVLGSVYSMAGMMLGSVMAFYASRWLGRKHLARLIGGKAAQRLDGLADSMGGRVVFWARMLPVVNFDWISFLAGLTSIRFWPFFIYSFFGMLTPTIIGVAAGDALGRDIRITLAIGGVWVGGIVASALFFYYRRRRWQAARRRLAPGPADTAPEFRS
ncbi:MAG: TVP38/TMEM64 family protein [Tepidiformaceae bacterium]